MSYLDAYFNAGSPKKKKRSGKGYVVIKGKAYPIGSVKARKKRHRPADLNGSGYLGMYTQPARSTKYMFGFGYGNSRSGNETVQNAKAIYNTGKGMYAAGRGGYILGKALYGKLKKKDVVYEVSHGDKGGMEFIEKFRSFGHAKAAEQKYKLKGKRTSLKTLFG